MVAKTPKAAQQQQQQAPQSNGGAKSAKQQQSAKKEVFAQQQAKAKTPSKELFNQSKDDDEDEDDESDDDDEDEKKVLGLPKSAQKIKADPEDEEMDEEDEEDEDFEDDEEGGVIDLADEIKFGAQQGFAVPPNDMLVVYGATLGHSLYPFHITNACLGPDADDDDRATLIVRIPSQFSDSHDHEHDDDEEHDHEHDHDDEDDEELMEIMCGTMCKNRTENLNLDLVISSPVFYVINTSANTPIFVTGRLLVNDDDDEENYELGDEEEDEEVDDEEEEEALEDEEEDEEDEEDEDKEDKAAVAKRAQEMRKRLLESTNGDAAKKPKVEPKVIDVKPGEKKQQAPTKQGTATQGSASSPKSEAVLDFILGELKTKKTIKNTELGSMIANKFGMPFKKMGFTEGTVTKFLEAHAKGKVEVSGDAVKLV